MQIPALINTQQTSFTSLNNPIKSFKIKTLIGDIMVSEFKEADSDSVTKLTELATFLTNSYTDGSHSPYWRKFKNPKNHTAYENRVFRTFYNIRNIFKRDDGNTNILVARNTQGAIVGGIISHTMDTVKELRDSKTMYIDSLGVNKWYRRHNIAKTLMNKVIKSGKQVYDDSILVGYNSALPFYQKLGYKKVNLEKPIVKMFFEIMREDRKDFPKYSKLLTKTINRNNPRWWERMSERINEYYGRNL